MNDLEHSQSNVERLIDEFEKKIGEAFALMFKSERKEQDLENAKEIILNLSRREEGEKIDEKLICEGLKHYYGWEYEESNESSLELFREYVLRNEKKESKKAMLGNIFSMIAKIYKTFQDYQEIKRFYERAIECENIYAIRGLGLLYKEGEGEIEKDMLKAKELFEKGERLGDSGSIYYLGVLYEIGEEGIEKDINKAKQLYERAGELYGDSEALYSLSFFYSIGEGDVEKNMTKAVELLMRSSDLGNCDSMNQLARYYYLGDEIPRNFPLSIKFFKKAAKLGNLSSIKMITDIYLTGEEFIQPNIFKAIKYLELGYKQKCFSSLEKLIEIYQFGKNGINVDNDKVISLLYDGLCWNTQLYYKRMYEKRIINFLKNQMVNWSTFLHFYWPSQNKEELDNRVAILLFISKYRKECKTGNLEFLVKGIVMNIIKFLCHFN